MAFAGVLAFIFLLGLSGRKPTKGNYFAVVFAALVASVWEYLAA
jgi:hypothetical protein